MTDSRPGTAVADGGESVTLYRLHGCPYCERIARKLDDYGVPYHSFFVAGEHSRRDAVARVAGTRAVPVIVDPEHGVTMAESGNIVEYLDRTYGGSIEDATESGAADDTETADDTAEPQEAN